MAEASKSPKYQNFALFFILFFILNYVLFHRILLENLENPACCKIQCKEEKKLNFNSHPSVPGAIFQWFEIKI